MTKKPYRLALAALLSMPVISLLGGMLFNAIDPEIALRSANYERNFRLLQQAGKLVLLATLLVNLGLWLLCCFFLLKAKAQSLAWLLLAVLGPFGFIVLATLRDRAPAPEDRYRRFVDRLKIPLRVVYELFLFVAVWLLADQAVAFKRALLIAYQAALTGMSEAQIIAQQDASSGMWAFSEGLEILYLVVLFYLLWPLGFKLLGRCRGFGSSANPR